MEKIKTTIKPGERKFSSMGGDMSKEEAKIATLKLKNAVEESAIENAPVYSEGSQTELNSGVSRHDELIAVATKELENKLEKSSPLFNVANQIMRDLATIITYSPKYTEVVPEKVIRLAAEQIAIIENRMAIQKLQTGTQERDKKNLIKKIADAIEMTTTVVVNDQEKDNAIRYRKDQKFDQAA